MPIQALVLVFLQDLQILMPSFGRGLTKSNLVMYICNLPWKKCRKLNPFHEVEHAGWMLDNCKEKKVPFLSYVGLIASMNSRFANLKMCEKLKFLHFHLAWPSSYDGISILLKKISGYSHYLYIKHVLKLMECNLILPALVMINVLF